MLNAHDLDFEPIRPIDLNNGALTPGSKATPFSTLLWAVVAEDIAAAEAQITDDIEWGLMPYHRVLKGKDEVLPCTQILPDTFRLMKAQKEVTLWKVLTFLIWTYLVNPMCKFSCERKGS